MDSNFKYVPLAKAKIGPVCAHFDPMLAWCFVLATVSQAWRGG